MVLNSELKGLKFQCLKKTKFVWSDKWTRFYPSLKSIIKFIFNNTGNLGFHTYIYLIIEFNNLMIAPSFKTSSIYL